MFSSAGFDLPTKETKPNFKYQSEEFDEDEESYIENSKEKEEDVALHNKEIPVHGDSEYNVRASVIGGSFQDSKILVALPNYFERGEPEPEISFTESTLTVEYTFVRRDAVEVFNFWKEGQVVTDDD